MFYRNQEIKQDWWPIMYIKYCSSREEANELCKGIIQINNEKFFEQRLDPDTPEIFIVRLISDKHVILENDDIEDEESKDDQYTVKFPVKKNFPAIVSSFIGVSKGDKIFEMGESNLEFRDDEDKYRAFDREEEYCVIIEAKELDEKMNDFRRKNCSTSFWGELDSIENYIVEKKKVLIKNTPDAKVNIPNNTAYLGEFWLFAGLFFNTIGQIELGALSSAFVMRTEELNKLMY